MPVHFFRSDSRMRFMRQTHQRVAVFATFCKFSGFLINDTFGQFALLHFLIIAIALLGILVLIEKVLP